MSHVWKITDTLGAKPAPGSSAVTRRGSLKPMVSAFTSSLSKATCVTLPLFFLHCQYERRGTSQPCPYCHGLGLSVRKGKGAVSFGELGLDPLLWMWALDNTKALVWVHVANKAVWSIPFLVSCWLGCAWKESVNNYTGVWRFNGKTPESFECDNACCA